MALPAAYNQLKLSDIQTEFGGSNPISLIEYYKNGSFVLAGDTAPNVPTSGMIKVSNFFSAAKAAGFPITNTYDSGSDTVTAPSGAVSVTVYVWGGGGAGGLAFAGTGGNAAGGGGGSGAYAVKTFSVTGGTTQLTYSVGAGGVFNQLINPSPDGGDSTVYVVGDYAGTLVTAGKGYGGYFGYESPQDGPVLAVKAVMVELLLAVIQTLQVTQVVRVQMIMLDSLVDLVQVHQAAVETFLQV